MPVIQSVQAREILDSRGFPTVEVELNMDGYIVQAAVPSGASTGSREAIEKRDGGQRYLGKGVKQAIDTVNTTIATRIVGESWEHLSDLDRAMCDLDGTDNKSQLGANAILGVSMAAARGFASVRQEPLYRYLNTGTPVMPMPMMNVLNGGAHADNNVDVQEFMVMPLAAKSFQEALRQGAETYHALKSVLKKYQLSTAVGDEGGFAPNLSANVQAIEVLLEAIDLTGLKAGTDMGLALDVAASEWYADNQYHVRSENKILTSEQVVDYFANWVRQYPILSIEDAMDEQDWRGWQLLTETLGQDIQLVGDDLFVTNPAIFKQGISQNIANAILIKPNQIGTVTETLEAIAMAQHAGYGAVVSHRSGETEDTFIADLAVATGVGQIKTGAPCRSDRVAKYNQCLRIEERALFAYRGSGLMAPHFS